MHQSIKMSNEEHTENDSPLSSAGKSNPFTVPKDYFEYLPAEINERIHSRKSGMHSSLLKPAVAISSLALCVIVAAVVVYFLKGNVVVEEEFLLSENEIEFIISNPGLFNLDEKNITEQYISMNIEEDEYDEQTALPEEEVTRYLEENLNTYNINEL